MSRHGRDIDEREPLSCNPVEGSLMLTVPIALILMIRSAAPIEGLTPAV